MSNKNIDYLTKHYNEFIYPRPIEDIQKDLLFTTDIIERNIKRIYQESTATSFALN